MLIDHLRTLLSPSNPVFARVREGKRVPNALVAVVVLGLLLFFAVGSCVIAIMVVTGDPDLVDRFMEGPYVLFIPFILLTLLLLLWVRFFEKRSLTTLGLIRDGALISYVRGFVLGLVFMGVVVGVMAIAGGVTMQTEGIQPSGSAVFGMFLIMLVAYIIQGGTEEVVIRGWFMQVLGARYRPLVGVAVSSVIFSAMHWAPNPVAIVNLFLFALFLALYSLRTGNIWGICGWHSAWNWAMGNIFGLAVSGHEQSGVLFDLQPTGQPLLTGGDYGPEGSLVATAVLFLGIVAVVMFRGRRTD